MNIFIPYCHDKITLQDIEKSIESLDDKRLIKQILETKQIYNCYLKYKNSTDRSKGYINHPIVQHYIKYPEFLSVYGEYCCEEYYYRFNKHHIYELFFKTEKNKWEEYYETYHLLSIRNVIPFYIEKSKKDPTNIRTTKHVDILFQQKLKNKWYSDILEKNRIPKWTKREIPSFFIQIKNITNISNKTPQNSQMKF